MKPEFSRQIFETYSNVRSSESRAVPYGRTERHDEANVRFSQFCEKRLKITACNEFTMNCVLQCHTYWSTQLCSACHTYWSTQLFAAVPHLLEHTIVCCSATLTGAHNCVLQCHTYWSTQLCTAVPHLLEHTIVCCSVTLTGAHNCVLQCHTYCSTQLCAAVPHLLEHTVVCCSATLTGAHSCYRLRH